MKKVILILFLIITRSGFTQNPTEIQKLAATCKVWGFLKYYHPKVANGEFNWDDKLFEILPKIAQAKTNEEFSITLENWITSFGEIKKNAPIIVPKNFEYLDKNFDLSWFDNKLFSKKLSQKLKFIEENRFQGEQFYIKGLEGGNVFVKNENFTDFKFEDKNSRLLALFRYWNVIEYFFPYKYLMDNNWDKTLNDMVPIFLSSQNETDFQNAIAKINARINDSHAYFGRVKPEKKNKERMALPFNCKIIDEKMIITKIYCDSLAKVNNLKIGDVITKINNKPIKEIIAENRDIIPASNEAYYLYCLVIQQLFNEYSETINLTFLEDNKIKNINYSDLHDSFCNKYKKDFQKKEKFKFLDNNIGYVNMGEINVKTIPEMIEKLSKTKAIVFDLRNYPKETLYDISDFICGNSMDYIKFTKPDLTYPGKFYWSETDKIGKENKNNYKGKVIVLLNEYSISQSEQTAMAFQTAPNTTIIGSQTAGADGNNCQISFIKDYLVSFTGIGVYYPDRRETQRIGIIPDIEVKPTILGIQQGKDEVLDRAIQFIETGK